MHDEVAPLVHRVSPASILQNTRRLRNLLWNDKPIPPFMVQDLIEQTEAMAYYVLAKRGRWRMRRRWRTFMYQVNAWRRQNAARPLPPMSPAPEQIAPPAQKKQRKRKATKDTSL